MHVWERECMGSACTGDHGDAGAPASINAHMHSLPSTRLESYNTVFAQNIHELDSCICHCEKISQTTVKPKCDNVEHVKIFFFF